MDFQLPTSRPARAGLSLLAGAMMCAALPPWGWWPLCIIGVALWALLLDSQPARSRFWVGAGVGLALYLPSTVWMVKMTPVGWPVAVSIWFPLVFGIVSAACPPKFALVALPGLVVLSEWVRWHAPFGGVPLSMFAYTQGRGPLLPIARVFGTLGVSGAVAVAGCALAALLRTNTRRRGAIGAVALVALTVLSVVAPSGHDVKEITVAAVQGGGDQLTEHWATDYDEVLQRHLDAARSIDEPVDLIVLPENIVNVDGYWDTSPQRAKVTDLAIEKGATVVVGVVEDRDSSENFWNFATSITPTGEQQGRYDKVRRVPFGEYVPLRGLIAQFAKGQLPGRDAMPGTGPAVLDTTLGRLGVVISFETFFPRRVRDALHNDAQIVLNPTNGSSYWLTQVQTQQIATSTLRAVESGRWLVQAAPTGFSAMIAPSGEVVSRTAISEQNVLVERIALREGTTLAMWWREAPILLMAAAAVAVAWRAQRRRFLAAAAEPAPETAPAEVPL
ncbi:MAG: apolipoprotein N-acyltransferase [Actinobacteria bacterium]|nr:apolipoprotein N-acyltransferase [Actinomycetota bacterium]